MLCKLDGDVPLPAVWSYQVSHRSHPGPSSPSCCSGAEWVQENLPEEELPDFLKYFQANI